MEAFYTAQIGEFSGPKEPEEMIHSKKRRARPPLSHLLRSFLSRSPFQLRGRQPATPFSVTLFSPALRMSALAVAKSAFPMACTVKAQHLASLTTKAFFRKCQIRKSGSARVYAHAMRCAGGSPRAIFLSCTPAAPRRRNPSKSWTPALS